MSSRKWLMKTEPTTYSIDHLVAENVTHWEGVRNYQARNFMKNDMRIGDDVLFYHSNTKVPGIVGLATVCSKSYPDFFSWDPDSNYFDPKSTKENPRWFMVDVKLKCKLDAVISLHKLKEDPKLIGMTLLNKGSRLSVQPVTDAHYAYIIKAYTT
jgi:predicted RNA-binding protein with PUA-like domain